MSAEFELVLAGASVIAYASLSKHCPSRLIQTLVDGFGFAVIIAGTLLLLFKLKV